MLAIFPRRISWLHILIGINLTLFIIPTLITILLQSRVQEVYGLLLYLLGGLNSDWAINQGEIWRLITSTFLHVDVFHIGANMFALFQLGRIVEEFYGGKQLWTFYILSGLGGSLLSVVFLGSVSTVGASGAVFGLIGVLLGVSFRSNPYSLDLPFRPMDVAPIAIYAFLVGIIPNYPVNNWAHLGGFVVGALLGYTFSHKLTTYKPKWMMLSEKMLFVLTLALTVVAFVLMIFSVGQHLNFISVA